MLAVYSSPFLHWPNWVNVFWLCFFVLGILVPRPGIRPVSPAMKYTVLTTGPLGNSLDPSFHLLKALFSRSQSCIPAALPAREWKWKCESESCSVVSNSLQPHGLYSHGTLQARILEWVAFPFSRESSQPRDQTQVSHIAGRFLTNWAIREAQNV